MAATMESLLQTALVIWAAAIVTFVAVAIGIINIHGEGKYEKSMKVGADFLFIRCPIGLFVIFAISHALKFLGE